MSLIKHAYRFARDTKGLAALEFALLLPMMVFLLFGSIDLIDVMSVNARAQNVAASLADVVARDDAVSNAEITGLWSAMDTLMYPSNTATMRIRISSISIVNASTARVVWSEGHGMAARTANSTITLPPAMMNPGTSVIVAESSYQHTAPLGFLWSSTVNMTHDAYRRSRLIDPIPRVQ
jgi:Flp pilus assembly protein TadG